MYYFNVKGKVSLLVILFVVLIMSISTLAGAESVNWPTRNVRWIVPTRAGGGNDAYSRGLARAWEYYLPKNVNILVENLPGADYRIGINQIYFAEPDGHTVGIFNIPGNAITQLVSDTRYDLREVTWLGIIDTVPFVMGVALDSPYNTLEDLMQAEGLLQGIYSYSQTGAITSAIANKTLGLDIELITGHVGYESELMSVLRGDTHVWNFSVDTARPHIEDGEIKPLVVYTHERLEWMPDVPCIAEYGYPELADGGMAYRMVGSTPNIPPEIASKMRETLWETMHSPEFLKWGSDNNRPIGPLNHEDAERIIHQLLIDLEKQADFFKEKIEGN